MNVAGTANRKTAPAATRVIPTPVLIIRRQSTGWTRLGLFKLGLFKPGLFKPGLFKPGLFKPGLFKPGQERARLYCP